MTGLDKPLWQVISILHACHFFPLHRNISFHNKIPWVWVQLRSCHHTHDSNLSDSNKYHHRVTRSYIRSVLTVADEYRGVY